MTTWSAAEPAGAAMYCTPLCTDRGRRNVINVLKTHLRKAGAEENVVNVLKNQLKKAGAEENVVNVLKTPLKKRPFLCIHPPAPPTARSSYPFGPVDVVSEGKEGVRAEDHRPQRADPVLLLSSRQRLGDLVKHGLPNGQIWALPTEETDSFATVEASSQTGG